MATETEVGFKPLKTREDWRLFFHSLALALAPVFIVAGFATDVSWAYWSGLVLALVDAVFSFVMSADGVRRVLYALSGLVVAIAIVLNLGDPTFITSLVGAIVGALSSVIAVFYTPSSVAGQVQ